MALRPLTGQRDEQSAHQLVLALNSLPSNEELLVILPRHIMERRARSFAGWVRDHPRDSPRDQVSDIANPLTPILFLKAWHELSRRVARISDGPSEIAITSDVTGRKGYEVTGVLATCPEPTGEAAISVMPS
jgi:hypothetical protein